MLPGRLSVLALALSHRDADFPSTNDLTMVIESIDYAPYDAAVGDK